MLQLSSTLCIFCVQAGASPAVVCNCPDVSPPFKMIRSSNPLPATSCHPSLVLSDTSRQLTPLDCMPSCCIAEGAHLVLISMEHRLKKR